jgi:hypothetical protein
MIKFTRGDALPAESGGGQSALAIRRAIYAHDVLTPDDMDCLFSAIRAAGPNPDSDWTNLFSEALTDYVVNQSDPREYISEDKDEWLMNELAKNGGVSTKAEWSMLIDVMNRALGVPPSLSAFALKEIATAIVTGKRGAFSDEDHAAGIVTKGDAEALRAVLYAATTGTACHVTREEAEVLFDIAHATASGKTDPAFDDLFARAVGNYLMAVSLHAPSAAEELHRETWLDEREAMGGFFSRLMAKSKMRFFDTLKSSLELAEEDRRRLEADDDRARSQSERITESEAGWVLEHMTRGGKLTSAEKRLLQWLAAETHALPAELNALVSEVNNVAAAPKPFGHRHAS